MSIGVPMDGLPAPLHKAAVAQMVVSVGPYRLKKRRVADQRAASSSGQASPATLMVAKLAGSSSAPTAASAEGGSVTI